mgnify:CR=1 FL=1
MIRLNKNLVKPEMLVKYHIIKFLLGYQSIFEVSVSSFMTVVLNLYCFASYLIILSYIECTIVQGIWREHEEVE